MSESLIQIRSQLAATLAALDRLIATTADDASAETDLLRYRASPGGMLSEEGVREMYRRFEIGEPDAIIARAMGVSVQGVAKRRTIWSKNTPTKVIRPDATILDVLPILDNAETYVRKVLDRMKEYQSGGEIVVRIGTTGTGKFPSYRLDYAEGEIIQAFGGQAHRPFTDVGIIDGANWSIGSMTLEEVKRLYEKLSSRK
jgi:hypothetical protein